MLLLRDKQGRKQINLEELTYPILSLKFNATAQFLLCTHVKYEVHNVKAKYEVQIHEVEHMLQFTLIILTKVNFLHVHYLGLALKLQRAIMCVASL